MKRILFLGAALLALSGAAATQAPAQNEAGPRLNYRAMRQLGFRLSCQAWTFRELTAYDTIDLVHKLGIRYIEFFPGQALSKDHPGAKLDENMSPELLNELKAKLQAANLKAVNYGVVGLPGNEAGARKVFDFAKALGLETIVSEPAEADVPMLDKLAQEYGINIAIHDHPNPSHYWNPDTVLKVAEAAPSGSGPARTQATGTAPAWCRWSA